MKKLLSLIAMTAFIGMAGFSTMAFADEAASTISAVQVNAEDSGPAIQLPADPAEVPAVSNENFLSAAVSTVGKLITEVGTKEGWAKAIAISLGLLQLFYKLLGTPMFANIWNGIKPNGRFIIVAVTSFATFFLTQLSMDVSFGAAALSSVTVIALVDYARKYYERFVETKKA